MIELQRNRLSNAIAKAKKARCRIRMAAWRVYEVTNPEGVTYTVTFDVRGGLRMGECTCRAGKNESECYHLAAAAQAHCIIARMSAAFEPICEPPRPAYAPRMAVNLDDNGPLYVPAASAPVPEILLKQQPPAAMRRGGFDL